MASARADDRAASATESGLSLGMLTVYSFKTALCQSPTHLRQHVRFQPVRLAMLATPTGVPHASHLSGLAPSDELLTTQLDHLAPQSVLQNGAHDGHRRSSKD